MRRYKKSVIPVPVDPEKWQPSPDKTQQLENLIRYRFDNNVKNDLTDSQSPETKKPVSLDSQFIEDCARIAAFLMDKQAVLAQLKKLDSLLESKKKEFDDKLPVSVLRTFLEEELAKFGFQPHFGKTLANVRPELFRAAISNGLLLKDAAIGDAPHGEFTHLIQWLVIAWQQEASHFLNKPVIDLFKQLGDESSVYYRDPPSSIDKEGSREEKSLWDIIIDNEGENDFRSPEAFNLFMLESSDLSTLGELLQNRMDKRTRDIEKFEKKYREVQSLSSPRLFYRKNNNIPYVGGRLEGILEPEDCKINFKAS
ncbi:LirA/MavJ family T4SS effector [Legionella israelensis]|uniref:DUF5636 domain-containing protein n=1 Tax=Legionella israelensis TaxID=454 RepID=A0A0W0W592_9GAMM|nr:LirA/MavJ family T4SS effector [Legionella israelensis]KTD27519.1 hypothetical protein Lisr_0978 [Legionella israelensis]QBS10589.1 hypothetical protein E4T55_12500 [Legionella israelensis]SCY36370.1 hypothetical protein SAMN02746069_02191 [Legionella israelensis DSM 19235]STX57533.1 Uncharacterised protein [Legionella israelensis]